MRNGRRTNHLVLHPIAQLTLIHIKMNPAKYIRHCRFSTDIGDGIAHPQVRADGTVERFIKNAENIRCGTADIYANNIYLFPLGYGLKDVTHCSGCWHDRSVSPFDKFIVSRGMSHDVLQEEIVNGITSRTEIFPLQNWPEIFHYLKLKSILENTLHVFHSFIVAGINNGELILFSETRFWFRRGY